MAEKKSFKATSVVLVLKTKKREELQVTANSFSVINFKDTEILSGEDYYIKKAVEAGAKAPKGK